MVEVLSCIKMEETNNENIKAEDAKIDNDSTEEGEITDEEEPTQVPETRSRNHKSDSSHHRSHHHSPSSRSARSKPSSHSSTTKKSSKYKDFDGKTTKPQAGEEVMMESWINGVHQKRRSPMYDSNEEYYSGGPQTAIDVEMKLVEQPIQAEVVDEYGDVDYRQHIDKFDGQKQIRRRSSSPIDGFGTMPKRPRNEDEEAYYPPPTRRGPIKNRWTENTICKFFREGFCREGDNCVYSHNAQDSHRRPELCRFYAQGYCKRGLACPNLHGEYPCKAFNKGECSKNPCQMSHQPLNSYTQPIFEQMIRDEELAKKLISNAGIKPRRKVLLPDGPVEWDKYFNEETLAENRSSLPPPGIVVPTVINGSQQIKPIQTASTSSSYGFFNAVPTHSQGRAPPSHPNNSPHQYPSVVPSQSKRMSPPQQPDPSFSLTDMLGKFGQPSTTTKALTDQGSLISPSLIKDSLQSLQSMFDSNIVDESPRSPPQSGIVKSDTAPVIPTTRGYIAYPLSIPDTCSSLDLNLIQQLTSGLYKNDPRLKRMAEKQFDLVSKTLEQQGGVQAIINQQKSATLPPVSRPSVAPSFQPPPITSTATQNMPIDPRAARDPRTARSAYSTTQDLPSTNAFEPNDFQSMIEKQLQMANEMARQENKSSEDFDMRSYESSYESKRHDSNSSYRGSSRFGRGSGRGRFGNRHGDEHSKRYTTKDDRNWNDQTDNLPNPKSTSPMRPAQSPPKDDQTRSSAPLTLREKRKDNTFESPLAARRF